MPQEDCESNDLLLKTGKRDQSAFRRLYTLHQKRVRYYIWRQGVRSGDIQDELCQEIFLKIWNKATLYSTQKGSATTWIAAVSQNVVRDHWRKIQRTPVGESVSEFIQESQIAEEHGDASHCDRTETWLTLEKALIRLSKDERSLFSLVYIQGLTLQQVSDKLGIPNGTVKWRINKIVKTLRSEVSG